MAVLSTDQFLDALLIRRVYQSGVCQIPFLLFCFFSQNMTVISVFPLDLSRACERKPLFGTGIGFHLGHINLLNKYGYFLLAFMGAIIMIILFPSSFGICSALP